MDALGMNKHVYVLICMIILNVSSMLTKIAVLIRKNYYLLLLKRFLFQSGVLLLKVVRLFTTGWNVVQKLLVDKTEEHVLKTLNTLKIILIILFYKSFNKYKKIENIII